MDISVPQQPDVPYLFRFDGDGILMVAPQVNPQVGFVVPSGFEPGTVGLVRLERGDAPVRLSDKQ